MRVLRSQRLKKIIVGGEVPNAVSAGGVRWGEGGGASVKATPAVAAARSANSLRIRPATEPRIVKSVATTDPSFKSSRRSRRVTQTADIACNCGTPSLSPRVTTVRRGPHRA